MEWMSGMVSSWSKPFKQAKNLLKALQSACQALKEAHSGKGRSKAEKALSKLQRLPIPSFASFHATDMLVADEVGPGKE